MVKMSSKAKKLFLDDYPISNLNLERLDPFFKSFRNDIMLVSSQGLFSIRNSKVASLKSVDKPLRFIDDFFEGQRLIIDESYFEEERVFSQLPFSFDYVNRMTFTYYVDDSSKVHLVVEGVYTPVFIQVEDTNVELKNKYRNFKPTNFYFLTNCREEMEFRDEVLLSTLSRELSGA
jgi:hypothetical protein